ncbi:bifunctional hydroxymethylpyrimidine kinase/phosphomethylpyrimidine kinase [Sulfurivirga sp.]|uniref:bifunctional hydroxymethylpyrimidine kinase/phosphomethylpyrimidine kinase n=1 Tax=Sulfurivirga sp. TaxID=2614236 RepID=UPI0025DDBEDC|nr:bifunctional hydroxymethylpyrimidine kinase/phosphomethylpyrimidine kinase [Sulfurivirga sp.]
MTPPIVLTLAGFDPGGGAGVLADAKAIHAHGGYAVAVITAQTVQNTRGVFQVRPEPADLVAAQLDALWDDLRPQAVKIGMLGSADLAEVALARLVDFDGPVVVDPVLRSSSGHPLLDDVDGRYRALLRRATLITPNLPEAARILGKNLRSAAALCDELVKMGETPCLLKGGHGEGDRLEDWLCRPGEAPRRFSHARLSTRHTHGTGCALSSAIATRLAHGEPLETAVETAINWLQRRLASTGWSLGQGSGPIDLLGQKDFSR